MDIKNYDNVIDVDHDEVININPFAPRHPFRLLIIGPSGHGKTNLLLNLLTEYIYYDKIYLYAKTADTEDKYLWLKNYLEEATNIANQKACECIISPTPQQIIKAWSENLDDLITVDDLDESYQNLIVFDDMTLENRANHRKISEHFIRGRKKNCSYIYIGHSFFLLPKVIRINISDVILFPPDNKREIQELAKTYATRISFQKFQEILNEASSSGHNFIFIDTRSKDIRMWIRLGFDQLFTPIQD